jgi:hypothetical protein
MNNKTIYISIPCLDVDSELVKTIESAIENANDKSRVYIGISFMNNKSFFNHIKEFIKYSKYENISLEYFPSDILNTVNIGRARNSAASLYNNQDYFLQLDAHTFLNKDWDVNLINHFESAKDFIKNDKLIISGLPGRYGYKTKSNVRYFWTENNIKYPQLLANKFRGDDSSRIPEHGDFFPETEFDSEYFLNWKKDVSRYFPLSKISAAFMFSDKNFASNRMIPDETIFWEEEFIQSIELVNAGFSLVFLHKNECVYHLYGQDMDEDLISHRSNINDLSPDGDNIFKRMAQSYRRYMDDPLNKEKIDKYIAYSKLDLIENKQGWQGYPTDFSR